MLTAEVAVMNRMAVALAADSAVTIGDGQKIYNSVNKLFMLSKYQPVGVMVHGNAELIGVPWESIIKTFRRELGKKQFDTLKEYGDCFLTYVNGNEFLFSEAIQEKHVESYIWGTFTNTKKLINKEVN